MRVIIVKTQKELFPNLWKKNIHKKRWRMVPLRAYLYRPENTTEMFLNFCIVFSPCCSAPDESLNVHMGKYLVWNKHVGEARRRQAYLSLSLLFFFALLEAGGDTATHHQIINAPQKCKTHNQNVCISNGRDTSEGKQNALWHRIYCQF